MDRDSERAYAERPSAGQPSERTQLGDAQRDLAECYRLTGADPDGASDAMLVREALDEVRRFRKSYSNALRARTGDDTRDLIGVDAASLAFADAVEEALLKIDIGADPTGEVSPAEEAGQVWPKGSPERRLVERGGKEAVMRELREDAAEEPAQDGFDYVRGALDSLCAAREVSGDRAEPRLNHAITAVHMVLEPPSDPAKERKLRQPPGDRSEPDQGDFDYVQRCDELLAQRCDELLAQREEARVGESRFAEERDCAFALLRWLLPVRVATSLDEERS